MISANHNGVDHGKATICYDEPDTGPYQAQISFGEVSKEPENTANGIGVVLAAKELKKNVGSNHLCWQRSCRVKLCLRSMHWIELIYLLHPYGK